MRAERQNMGRVTLGEASDRLKELQRERAATDGAAAGAVLDFEIGWLCEELGQVRDAAEAYLRGLTTMGSFRPNLSALVRLAEQTGANPRGLYEAGLKQSQDTELQLSSRIDLAYLGLASDNLDHGLLRALVLASQEFDDADTKNGDLGLALELVALRLGEDALSRIGRDLQIRSEDLSSLRPFLLEERLWEALRDHNVERSHFERTTEDVRAALASLNHDNEGRRAPLLELAAQSGRQAGQHGLEASWLAELAAFLLRLGKSDPKDLDLYSLITRERTESSEALASAVYFEAGDAKQRAGDHEAALGLLREAHALGAHSSELDRMIVSESLMLAAERAGELAEAGAVARGLLELEVPSGREQILWLRLSALERARGETEAAIIATGHALETHSESIAARAILLGHLTHAQRDADKAEALESWARHQSGETRALLFWQAAHLAARSTKSRSDGSVSALYDAAIAASEHPDEILREYADWSSNRHDHVEALLRLSNDPTERSALKRQRWVEDRKRLEHDAETALEELLSDEDCRSWAPAVVRYHAAQRQHFDLLARAHAVSAEDGTTEVKIAHLLAAARAHIRDGKTKLAEPHLSEVLRLDERNPYGIAMLAAVLQSDGQGAERVALLARVASKEDERTAAQRKTHSAASEAEEHGLSESAARSYQTFLQRYPGTPTIAWCFLRLADRCRNLVWREQALEHLASYERQLGHAGFGTLRWIEHLALLPHRTTAQQGALLSALAFADEQPAIGPTAQVWRKVLLPRLPKPADLQSLQSELLALSAAESDWRRAELQSGALRLMLLSEETQDDAFLQAQAQYEEQPTTQTALSSLEAVPWTAPATLGMRWEEVVSHWGAGLATLQDQAPDFVDASLMARWYLHCDRKEQALEFAERAVSEDPGDLASWMVLRNASLALQNWETFVQANEIVAEPLKAEARAELKSLSGFACAFGLGDSARASSYFLEALELDPLNEDAFGWVQQQLRGRQRNRLVVPLSARIDNTDDPRELLDLHLDLAMAHQAGSEFREAAMVLERALLLDESNEHLLAGVAETWIHLQEWERAQAALLSLANVAQQTDTFDTCILSAADILHTRLHDSDRAVALLESSYNAIAAKMPTLELLTTILEKQGKFREASAYAQQAIARTTRSERRPWLLRLGSLQERAGDHDTARESYREALDAEPSDSEAFEALLRCGMQAEERRIRARQLVSGLREHLQESHSTQLLRISEDLERAAHWNENVFLARCAHQVIENVSEMSSDTPAPRLVWRNTTPGSYLSIVPHIRLRAENEHDRAAHRLQDLLLSILEHALEAYGLVQLLDVDDPVAHALARASSAFGFESTSVFRSSQGDDALGLVLGADRRPAWVVGPNFALANGALAPSKSFIVGQLASAYALGVLPFVVREHNNSVNIWKSLRTAMGRSNLRHPDQRFEETLRTRVPKQLQAELEPLLRRTTNKQFRQWCEQAYEFVLRAGACFCGEIRTPLRAVDREGASTAARERLLRYWLSADAEAALRFFWSAP